MIYWTKYKSVYSEESDSYVRTNQLEYIKESDEDFVSDGEGFEIDMNGINYHDYLESPSDYYIEKGKLYSIK